MRFLGHSTVRLELAGRTVLTDSTPSPASPPCRARMRSLLVEPPRRFAAAVDAATSVGGPVTRALPTAPGSAVALPSALLPAPVRSPAGRPRLEGTS